MPSRRFDRRYGRYGRIGGFVFVEADACDRAALRDWIAMALGFVTRLPKK